MQDERTDPRPRCTLYGERDALAVERARADAAEARCATLQSDKDRLQDGMIGLAHQCSSQLSSAAEAVADRKAMAESLRQTQKMLKYCVGTLVGITISVLGAVGLAVTGVIPWIGIGP